jgi:hypothetical protein
MATAGLLFCHSPLSGANDKKAALGLPHYPGLRLLRGLTLGYHLPPLQGFGKTRAG